MENEIRMNVDELCDFFGKTKPTVIKYIKELGFTVQHGIKLTLDKNQVIELSKVMFNKVPYMTQKAIEEAFNDVKFEHVEEQKHELTVDIQKIIADTVNATMLSLAPVFENQMKEMMKLIVSQKAVASDNQAKQIEQPKPRIRQKLVEKQHLIVLDDVAKLLNIELSDLVDLLIDGKVITKIKAGRFNKRVGIQFTVDEYNYTDAYANSGYFDYIENKFFDDDGLHHTELSFAVTDSGYNFVEKVVNEWKKTKTVIHYDAKDMDTVVSILMNPNYGRNSLYKLLRDKNVLTEKNVPTKAYSKRELFKVETNPTVVNAVQRLNTKLLVCFPEGFNLIKTLVEKDEEEKRVK